MVMHIFKANIGLEQLTILVLLIGSILSQNDDVTVSDVATEAANETFESVLNETTLTTPAWKKWLDNSQVAISAIGK